MRNIKKAESLKRFGARLRQIRETAEISQEQIQYATGITQSHLSMIESGRLNTVTYRSTRRIFRSWRVPAPAIRRPGSRVWHPQEKRCQISKEKRDRSILVSEKKPGSHFKDKSYSVKILVNTPIHKGDSRPTGTEVWRGLYNKRYISGTGKLKKGRPGREACNRQQVEVSIQEEISSASRQALPAFRTCSSNIVCN